MASNVYVESVATSLIKQLEKGVAPWQQPWEAGEHFMPHNPTTGKLYQGMNAIALMSTAEDNGYQDTRWMTYKQALSLDAQVNKGEKGTLIQYWKWHTEIPKLDDNGQPVKDEEGKPIKIQVRLQNPRIRSAVVFNAHQITGLPAPEQFIMPEWERHQEAESILKDSGAIILHSAGDRAFYRPSTDKITLPLREQFPSADRYYATALHELGHWTGHETRLNRDLAHPFGSQGYAKEELRAEIASMMLGEQLSLGHDPSQHVAYVGSWIKALEEDPREIFKAAGDAERITKYLQGREMRQEQTQAQESPVQLMIPLFTLVEEDHMPRTPNRTYLNVAYDEKDAAKALGAKWDRIEKSWYAPANANPELVERWGKTDNLLFSSAPDPQSEFAAALLSAGLVLESAPVMDGELRRVQVEGDAKGQFSGAYVGYRDGHPAGFIQNFKTGFESNWKSSQKTQIISAADRARLEAEAAEKRAERAKEREAIALQTAQTISAHWNACEFASTHPYLTEKGIEAHGIKINSQGPLLLDGGKSDEAPQQWSNNGDLLVPVFDKNGQLIAAQAIDSSGRKSFPRGSSLQGGHFILGNANNSDSILIAEGYATAATLHEATQLPVVVAFNSGNLPYVSKLIREKYPEKVLIIAGDNDHRKPHEKNVGRLKAEDSANKVNGYLLLPTFEKMSSGSDWNDFQKEKGKGAVQHSLNHGLAVIKRKHSLGLEKNQKNRTSNIKEATSEKSLTLSM